MSDEVDADQIAAALLASVSVFVRRIRQLPVAGELSMPERSALAQLDSAGPATSSELARRAQITAQAMGATLGALQDRGLVERSPDPKDGRRVILTVTATGRQALQDRRNAKTELIAHALTSVFTPAELERLGTVAPLLERLARNI